MNLLTYVLIVKLVWKGDFYGRFCIYTGDDITEIPRPPRFFYETFDAEEVGQLMGGN